MMFKHWVALLTAFLCVNVTYTPQASSGNIREIVRVSLEVFSNICVPYEPVYFSLRIKNESSDSKAMIKEPQAGRVRLICSGVGTNESVCNSPSAVLIDPIGLRSLNPGEAVYFQDVVFDTPSGIFFRSAGEYTLRAEFATVQDGKTIRLQSPSISIQISTPSSEDTLAGVQFEKAAVRSCLRGNCSPEAIDLLRDIAKDHPTSRLADHANYILGRYYALQYYDAKYVAKSSGANQLSQRAMDCFSAVTDKNAGLQLVSLLHEGRIAHESGINTGLLLTSLEGRREVAGRLGMTHEFEQLLQILRGAAR